MKLDGDFSSIVGDKEEQFKSECSLALRGVSCTDVKSGSIIVEIEGKQSDVQTVLAFLQEHGLSLPSFGTLPFSNSKISNIFLQNLIFTCFSFCFNFEIKLFF